MRKLHVWAGLICLWLFSAIARGDVIIPLVVHVPTSTPESADVYLAWSCEPNPWNPSYFKLTRQEDGTYRGSLPINPVHPFEFKFTLGTWETVEKDADGSERPNRQFHYGKAQQKIEATVEAWASTINARPRQSSVIGSLTFHEIDSNFLNAKRMIRVWSSDKIDPDQTYRVLYMHDGQNLFDALTSSFGTEWQIDETLTKLIQSKEIAPLIVVGIDNGGSERLNEMTLVPDEKHGGGKGENYVRFVTEEVIPFMEKNYPVGKSREDRFIGGSSLGGLISLEIMRHDPEIFCGGIVMSPSLWWADGAILDSIQADPSPLKSSRVWIDVGTREDSSADTNFYVDSVKRLDQILTQAEIDHHVLIEEAAQHNEAAWARRFEMAIRYVMNQEPD